MLNKTFHTFVFNTNFDMNIAPSTGKMVENTVFPILFAISFSHLLNDTIQSLIPAIYPVIKESYHLSFSQIGLITLTFQMAASLFQPFVGMYTDKKPQPYSLAIGMVLLCLAW
jgi:FSR family fosmidomycin resistance protein-like MFS transporter